MGCKWKKLESSSTDLWNVMFLHIWNSAVSLTYILWFSPPLLLKPQVKFQSSLYTWLSKSAVWITESHIGTYFLVGRATLVVIITDVTSTKDLPTCIAFQRKEVWEKNEKKENRFSILCHFYSVVCLFFSLFSLFWCQTWQGVITVNCSLKHLLQHRPPLPLTPNGPTSCALFCFCFFFFSIHHHQG